MTTNQILKLEINFIVLKNSVLVRNNFSGDNNVSNIMLVEIFLSKYPQYLCNIKKD